MTFAKPRRVFLEPILLPDVISVSVMVSVTTVVWSGIREKNGYSVLLILSSISVFFSFSF